VVLILIAVLTLLIRQDPDEPDIFSTSLTDSPLGQFSNLF
jgi:hypothetical protein